ncbi:MAG: translation initiation factor [Bacteroidia bacterium]|nr:translation initiation factor [Bacteroidia bacterium]
MKKKTNSGIVYSTNPSFNFIKEENEIINTLAPQQQSLIIFLDKKSRAGKAVTLVKGFIGKEIDLQELGKFIKTKCGVGGSVKENEILIQGDFRQKIKLLLEEKGYKVKISGI